MYGYFLNINIFYTKMVRVCGFYERGKRYAKTLLHILSDFDFCGPPKKEQTAVLWKLQMCQKSS
jgi:hypothetical protein